MAWVWKKGGKDLEDEDEEEQEEVCGCVWCKGVGWVLCKRRVGFAARPSSVIGRPLRFAVRSVCNATKEPW